MIPSASQESQALKEFTVMEHIKLWGIYGKSGSPMSIESITNEKAMLKLLQVS